MQVLEQNLDSFQWTGRGFDFLILGPKYLLLFTCSQFVEVSWTWST